MSVDTDQINTMIAGLWADISAQQSRHLEATGMYCQVPWTHSSPPSSVVAQDFLGQALPDGIDWVPSSMRCRLSIDTYGKPDGWTLTAQASVDGQIVARRIDCGVNDSRSCEWHVLEAAPW